MIDWFDLTRAFLRPIISVQQPEGGLPSTNSVIWKYTPSGRLIEVEHGKTGSEINVHLRTKNGTSTVAVEFNGCLVINYDFAGVVEGDNDVPRLNDTSTVLMNYTVINHAQHNERVKFLLKVALKCKNNTRNVYLEVVINHESIDVSSIMTKDSYYLISDGYVKIIGRDVIHPTQGKLSDVKVDPPIISINDYGMIYSKITGKYKLYSWSLGPLKEPTTSTGTMTLCGRFVICNNYIYDLTTAECVNIIKCNEVMHPIAYDENDEIIIYQKGAAICARYVHNTHDTDVIDENVYFDAYYQWIEDESMVVAMNADDCFYRSFHVVL